MTVKSQWERIGIQNRMSALDFKTQDGHVLQQSERIGIQNAGWSYMSSKRILQVLHMVCQIAVGAHWNLKTRWSCMSSKCMFACLAYDCQIAVGAHWN